jgi:hypothetical protein
MAKRSTGWRRSVTNNTSRDEKYSVVKVSCFEDLLEYDINGYVIFWIILFYIPFAIFRPEFPHDIVKPSAIISQMLQHLVSDRLGV